MYVMLDSMYVTMSISTGLYPTLELQNANKLHYIMRTSEALSLKLNPFKITPAKYVHFENIHIFTWQL